MASCHLRPISRRVSGKASDVYAAGSISMEEPPFSNKGPAAGVEVIGLSDEKISPNCALQRTRILSEMKKLKAPVRARSTSSLLGRGDAVPASTSSVVSLPACGTALLLDTCDDASPTQGYRPSTQLPVVDSAVEAFGLSTSLRPRSSEVPLGRSKSMPQLGSSHEAPETVSGKVLLQFAEKAVPASKLDLMDLPDPAAKASLELVMADAQYAVPFDAASWSNAPEALGELFATKLLEMGTTGKYQMVKAPRKSKKGRHVLGTTVTNVNTDEIIALDLSTEESAEEVIPLSKPFACKPNSAQSSRRRPRSTGSLRGCGAKSRLQECHGYSFDDSLLRAPSRKTLEPLPRVPECKKVHECEDDLPIVQWASAEETDMLRTMLATNANTIDTGSDFQALPRPQSASVSKQTINCIADANLWNIGFNDNDSYIDTCVWDCDREIYSAWGGHGDDWADASSNESDWGDDGMEDFAL